MNSPWLKFLPSALRAKLENRPNLQKAITNTGWLFADRILRLGVGMLLGVWMARYLGPAQFGLLNYAMAIVALFGAVASLGLNGIVVRELVQAPEKAATTLGTTFCMQVIGGLLALGMAVGVINLAEPDDSLVKLMVVVLGFGMVFKAAELVKCWFESQVLSKYVVWLENAAFLIFASVKGTLILVHASLMAFVWAIFFEGLSVAILLLGVYAWRGGVLRKWEFRASRARALLKDGWPLVLSGLAVSVYMRIDQIMLGQMMGSEAVGLYSAAVRISEVWYFIPTAIVASVYPSIVNAKRHSEALYYARLQRLYDLMVVISLGVAIPMTFVADWLVVLLFGKGFAEAGTVLALHIWTGLFVSIGLASGTWYLTENLQLMAFNRTLWGAVVNVVANLVLIPRYGIVGAAIGTILSQIAAAYLFDAMHAKTRPNFLMKTKSYIFFYRFRV